MNFLIVISCLIASAAAEYKGPIHIPVIGPGGVPVEPVEVQAARHNHVAALAAAYGNIATHGHPGVVEHGLPQDLPEVAAAKQQHYKDYYEAARLNGVHAPLVGHGSPYIAKESHLQAPIYLRPHYRRRRAIYGGYHVPEIGPGGVPVEPAEVQAARAQHLNALAQAATRSAPQYYQGAAQPQYQPAANYYDGPRYYGPPAQIGHDGQPLETPEVQAAKAYHFAAHAALRSGYYG